MREGRNVLGKYLPLLNKEMDLSGVVLSHYTSLSNLNKIISCSNLRASHGQFMNDPLDGFSVYAEMLKQLKQDLIFTPAVGYVYSIVEDFLSGKIIGLDVDIRGYALNDIDRKKLRLFRVMYKHMQNRLFVMGDSPSVNFVVSFSLFDENESVSSWVTYGDDGKGVRLDFNGVSLRFSLEKYFNQIVKDYKEKNADAEVNTDMIVKSCAYRTDKQLEDMACYIIKRFSELNDNGEVYFYKNSIAVAMAVEDLSLIVKRVEYKQEGEIRFIFKNIPGNFLNLAFDVSEGKNAIIRKLNLGFDRNSIKNICCGPRVNVKSFASVSGFVRNFHRLSIDVERSGVSYEGK